MSTPVKLAAVFSDIRSRKDRSLHLGFDTRELGEDAAELMKIQGSECWLIIGPDEHSLDDVEVPTARPDSLTPRKTPAARQRSVMFLYWRQQGGNDVLGSFDGWYSSVIERTIDQWKAKLDQEDRSWS